MKIKMKSVVLPAGSVLAWKEYGMFTKLWRKLNRKPMPNNKFIIAITELELVSIDKFKTDAYAPIRKYNKQEIRKLNNLLSMECGTLDWETVRTVCNIVRPNTFTDTATIEDSKYYKKIDLNEESDEYIY